MIKYIWQVPMIINKCFYITYIGLTWLYRHIGFISLSLLPSHVFLCKHQCFRVDDLKISYIPISGFILFKNVL